jgi:hypothetical protein
MPSSGMLRRVALLRTDDFEERGASIISVTRIGILGTSAVTSNRRKLRRNTKDRILHSHHREKPQILHSINRLDSVAET